MQIRRKPHWLQKKVSTADHAAMDRLLGSLRLNTVCREASCPNITECFRQKQATFLIMGKECTRSCSFCNVSANPPSPVDPDEPARVAEAVIALGLQHVVITSPTRDDLPDGGAGHFAAAVKAIRKASPQTVIELLVPDFQGSLQSLATVTAAKPDIFGHNIETVPRLYSIRAGADYQRSLDLLKAAKQSDSEMPTKTGLMLGLGETSAEVLTTLIEIRSTGCDYLSIGQYLAPSRGHFPVAGFIEPAEFDHYRTEAMALGFVHVESAPYVRSSYHADRYRQD